MMRGGTPAVAAATMRARGVSPCRFAASALATMTAQAPSFTPLALPAVTLPPSLRKGVGSLASASSVVSGRRCSSCSTLTGSPLRRGMVDRDDLLGEAAVLLRLAGALLRAVGEGVLVGAGDLEVLRDVLRRLRHGVDAVLGLHLRD